MPDRFLKRSFNEPEIQMPGNLGELLIHTRKFGKQLPRTKRRLVSGKVQTVDLKPVRSRLAIKIHHLRSLIGTTHGFPDVLQGYLDWELGFQDLLYKSSL